MPITKSQPRPYIIDPRELRHQIQIQQQTSTQDSFGQPQATWSTVLTTMAKIASVALNERFQNEQFVAQISHRIIIRWPGTGIAIVGGMRILFGTRVFLIQVPDNVEERNSAMHLLCLEINPAASA